MATETLYELGDARRILEEWLLETDGEVTPELEQLLAELDEKADEKIERVALYIREQLARAEAVKVEEQRLAGMRRARERAADGLKRYLEREMDRLGKTKVTGLLCTVALQKNPPSVKGELTQEQLKAMAVVAPGVVTFTPASYSLDRRAVLLDWKNDGYVPEGLTIEQSVSVRIR